MAGIGSLIKGTAKLARRIGDEFDPRFDPRKKEQERPQNLEVAVEPRQLDRPQVSIADFEGYPFVTSMSDRTAAGGLLTDVRGVPLSQPVDLRGGQDFMFDYNPGQVWASGKGQAADILSVAKTAKYESGRDPLFLPWRMAPTGGDFATMTGETMLSFARDSMNKKTKRSLDSKLKKIIPNWPGIDSPDAIDTFRAAPDASRKEAKNVMDVEFRNRGGLSIGEARLAVADPAQLAAQQGGVQNVGRIRTDREIDFSTHPAYPMAVPGEGVGVLQEDINVFELLPDIVEARAIPDPLKPRDTDLRSMQMGAKSGLITSDLLRKILGGGAGAALGIDALLQEEAQAAPPMAAGMALGGAVSSAATKAIRRLVEAGFPESTAEKIVMGELPMDPASKAARMAEQGYTTPAYSGSTFDIRAFDTSRSNPESDFGIGTYATTSPLDATANYAGVGPDLTNRIGRQSELLADVADDEFALSEMLDEVGLTLNDYYADEAGALEQLARSQMVGEAPGGVTYPLRINTQNYAVIGGENPTILRQQRDYDQEAFAELGPGADSHDAFDRALELMYEDPQGLYARVRQALLETDAGDNVDAINSVMADLEDDIVDGMVRIQDIDAAIRRNALSGQDFMTGDDVPFGDISRQTLQNLGFEGVVDNTANMKFGTERKGFAGARVPGMTGVTPDTSHIITFPGQEKNIRSQFAAFDPDQTGSSNILASLGPAAIGAGLFGASMAPEEAEAAGFGTLARAIGRPTQRLFQGSSAKFARPSMQSVGTGTGNQAFGYGLYFTEAPDIAGTYKRGLANKKMIQGIEDQGLVPGVSASELDEMIDEGVFGEAETRFLSALRDADYLGFDNVHNAAMVALKRGDLAKRYDAANDPAVAELDKIANELGFLYEVEVPEGSFIEWDLPLGQQPEVVQQVVKQNAPPELKDRIESGQFKGLEAYYLFGKNPEVNSMMWAQYGVPGVRYSSVRTKEGKVSPDAPRNYVIFDENLINIVRRNDEALENNFDELAARASALDVRKPLAATLAAGAAGTTQAEDLAPGEYDAIASQRLGQELDRLMQLAEIRRQPSIEPLDDTAMARVGDYLLEDRPSEMDTLQRALQRLDMAQGLGDYFQTTGQGDPTTIMQDLLAGLDIFDVLGLLPGAGKASSAAVRAAQ